MYGYIYKTTDLLTQKIYVGKKKSDKFLGLDYIGSGTIITRIKQKLKQNGQDVSTRFVVELLSTAESKDELNYLEKYFIALLDCRNSDIGYNLRAGGDCGPGGPMFKNHKHTEETKLQMSINRSGKNNANYGNHWTLSTELKLLHSKLSSGCNNGMYGKHHTDESKEKSRKSHVGKIAVSDKERDIVKMIYPEQLEEYLQQGFIKGNIHAKNYLL